MLVMKAAGDENNSLNDAVHTICTKDELTGTILGYAMSEDMNGFVSEDFNPDDEQGTVEEEVAGLGEVDHFFVIGDDEDTDTEGMEVLIIPLK